MTPRKTNLTVLLALGALSVSAFAQDRAPMSLGSEGGTRREPYGAIPRLHPGVDEDVPFFYYKPPERLDYYVQAAGSPVAMSQSGGVAGQTLAPAAKAPLALVEHGPSGELGNASSRPQVYLGFSQPMVAIARLGTPMASVPGVTISPPLRGRWRWISTRSLTFDPDDDLAPFTRYTVGVEGLESLYGDRLAVSSFSFHKGSFAMRSVRSVKAPDKSDDLSPAELSELLVTFNQEARPEYLATRLVLRDADGEYRIAVSGWDAVAGKPTDAPGRFALVRVTDRVPENRSVELVLKAGSRASPDGVPTEFDASLRLSTLRPFTLSLPYGDYVQEGLYRYRADDANAIWLRFSHPVDAGSVLRAVRITTDRAAPSDYDEYKAMKNPSVDLPSGPEAVTIPASAVEVFGTSVRINGLSFGLTETYKVSVSEEIRDVHGRALTAGGSFKFRLGNPLSYVYFPHTGVKMLEASFPPRVIAEVQDAEYLRYAVERWNPAMGDWDLAESASADLASLPPQTKHFELLDLRPWLNADGKGRLRITWNAKDQGRYPRAREASLDVQVTDLAVTARVAYNMVLCRVTSISTGEPVAGATVRLLDYRAERLSAKTGADGVASFRLGPGEYIRNFYSIIGNNRYPSDNLRVVAEKGSDRIEWTPSGHDPWRFDVAGRTTAVSAESPRRLAFLFSDRKIYRPGETVSFRGLDRVLTLGVLEPPEPGDYRVRLKSRESGETIAERSGVTLETGGFWGEFELPDDLKPGEYSIDYRRIKGGKESAGASEGILVSNFRRLQFEAFFEAPAIAPTAGDELAMELNARYLAGGAMRDAYYSGSWTREPYSFSPTDSRLRGLYFGQEDEWAERSYLSAFSGQTDGEGKAAVRQMTGGDGVVGKPYRYRAQATVTDSMTGQSVSASRSAVVYPADFLVGGGVREAGAAGYGRYFAKGKGLAVDMALAEPDGSARAPGAPVDIAYSIVRKEWKLIQQQGVSGVESRWEEREAAVASGTATARDGARLASASFETDEPGQYTVTLSARDGRGGVTACRFSFWVTGKSWVNWYSGNVTGISLSPERVEYAPGDTARILMRSPLPAGDYIVTTEREGIMSSRVVSFDGPTQVLEVPVEERHVPVFYVAVASYSTRSGPPEHAYGQPDLDKPKSYFGLTQVRVSTDSRRIRLEITPDAPSYLPGSEASFTIRATRDGRPVPNAELVLMAVDRGVVDIVDYHVPDPMAYFYRRSNFPLGTRGGDTRDMLMDPVTYEVKDQFGGDAGKDQLRKDFNPTAVFVPAALTGPDGTARVSFTWPDNLTTYRCTALAITADRFGLAEREVQVRNPVNVKTNLPRRMRVRDTAMAGVIVTNMDAKPQTVTVTASSDILTIVGQRTKTVIVASGDTKELAFMLGAERAGEGEVVFRTRSESHNESLVERYAVDEPSTFETVASIGSVGWDGPKVGKASATEGIVLPLQPNGADGSLELTLGSSRLPMLGSAMRYVIDYPYGCNEQLCSRLLPLIVFGDYADAFGLSSRVGSPRAVAQSVMADIAATQRPDGGFGVWAWSAASVPYIGLRVAQAAAMMAEKGWDLPRSLDRDKLHAYIQKSLPSAGPFDQAYGLYALAQAGVATKADAETRLREAGSFRAAEWSFLGLAFMELDDRERARQCMDKARGFIRMSPRSVDVEGTGWGNFNTRLVALALALELQSRLDPTSDFASRVVQTMVDELGNGYWQSTNTTYWVLHAFAALIEAEGGTPDFRARVTADGEELLSAEFRGLSGRRELWRSGLSEGPLAPLDRERLLPLVFERDGSGHLYYGTAMRYAVPTETALNRDQGMEVVSSFTMPDGSPIAAGPLRRGSLYRLTVTVSTDEELFNVAVRMPIPAGADIVESMGPGSSAYGDGYDDYASSRIKAFDTEAHAYVDTLYPGTHSYSIVFRAVAAGVYTVPPATAECMYQPEIFGRDVANLIMIGL